MNTVSLSLQASTSNVLLGDLEHPNRMPFSGILTYFNVPSENPPNGSDGLPVMIPTEVGEPALSSLVGMAVNYVPFTMDGHNPQNKIGVITSASLGDTQEDGSVPVLIQGYLYAMDFEEAATSIKLNQSSLGFSYETAMTILVDGLYNGEEVAVVQQLGYFTGASILLKDAAAYTSTQLVASKDKEGIELNEEQVKQLIKLALEEYAKQDEVQDKKDIEDAKEEDKAEDKEDVKASDDEKADEPKADDKADEKSDDKADEPKAEDKKEDAPADDKKEEVKAEEDSDENSENDTESETVEAGDSEDDSSDVDKLKAEIEDLKNQVKALSASTEIQAAARKSVAYPTTLMAKYQMKEDDSYENLMASIDKMDNLSIEDRMALKLELRTKSLKGK